MSHRLVFATFGISALIFALGRPPLAMLTEAATTDPHAYFNALVARPDVFKAYSLRPVAGAPKTSPDYANQLLQPKLGGYAACNSCDLWITYGPDTDTDPNKQDAAKVVIPAFIDLGQTLGAAISSSDNFAGGVTMLSVPGVSSTYQAPRTIRVDNELMTVVDPDGAGALKSYDSALGTLYVKRAQFGTVRAAHAAGARLGASSNTIPNAVRLPLGTSDGHTYLFTWDAFWTDSYLSSGLTNHKAFNFISGGIWLEPGAFYASPASGFKAGSDVAELNVRSYQNPNGPASWLASNGDVLGPGTNDNQPLGPRLTTFIIRPNTWTRYWVQIRQRANDYDYMDFWVADESTDPVQIYRNIPLSVRTTSTPANSIQEFLLEFNTSTSSFVRGDTRDFITYVRNFVSLADAGDPTNLLVRPSQVPKTGLPGAPRNVRILSQ
jgi:hypothetical protein